uniref:Uncharacterized protein n=1 Tax=Medicago truncatula TaxID=3880 RepID=I3S7D1_MEDTR|nr:unknown [Medicago truncatula]
MNQTEVARAYAVRKLAKCFNKGHRLDVPYSSTQFNDTNISRAFFSINRYLCYTFYPLLDSICDVWNNLDSFAKIISSSFLLNNRLINFSSCDIIVAG